MMYKSKESVVDRIPPWEPFEVNPNLTLESIVDDGYSFGAMPCGQVQYFKSLGDTSIQYEVEIKCNPLDSFVDSFLKRSDDYSGFNWRGNKDSNPYYPFNFYRVKRGEHKILWRVYKFSFDELDKGKIEEFIKSKNCRIIPGTIETYDTFGYSMMVFNPRNSLYFPCQVRKYNFSWEFVVVSHIPILDLKRVNS